MTVCKFFQQGYCRFGQSCRFEHIFGSKYSYQANNVQSNSQANSQNTITDAQLVNQVHTDVQSVLKGNQWLLSCYAPFKEKPNLPGITDLSPEEARLFIYEAKANNTLSQATSYYNSLVQDAKSKYEQLLGTNANLVNVLRKLYNGESVTSPFDNSKNSGFGAQNDVSSVFRSAVQSTSVFGQNNQNTASIFGSPNKNTFASQNTDAAKSLFSQANQNVFQNNQQQNPANIFASKSQKVFGNQGNVAFGQPTSPNQNVFQSATSPQSIFQKQESSNQNVFTQNQNTGVFAQNQGFGPSAPSIFSQQPSDASTNIFAQANTTTNIFATANSQQNVFGQNQANSISQPDNELEAVYSKREVLTAEDIEAFMAPCFQLGFIPEIAPSEELCT